MAFDYIYQKRRESFYRIPRGKRYRRRDRAPQDGQPVLQQGTEPAPAAPAAPGQPAPASGFDLSAMFSGETILGLPRNYFFIGAAVGLFFLLKKK